MAKDIRERPIGIFDSGVGGLTVFKELRRILPHEDIVYLGDTARVPYGTKSPKVVKRYTLEATLFLLSKGVKTIIVACNTASSIALDEISKLIPIPFFGVIEPGVEMASRMSKKKRIGVIGTEATIKSGAYRRAILRLDGSFKVFEKACPLFVPIVEEGHIDDNIARVVAEHYLSYFWDKDIDVLILGCTHYPLLKKTISDILEGITVVDSATAVSIFLKEKLKLMGILKEKDEGKDTFYVTDDPEKFIKMGGIFLGKEIRDNVILAESLEVFT